MVDKSKLSGSGIGRTTLNDGLTFGSYPFGTRAQDKKISINTPDLIKILGVFESLDTNVPILDKLSFVTGLGLDTNAILGEKIVGSDSKAIAQVTTRSSATEVEICYFN